MSLVSTPIWPLPGPAATWRLCVCYCKPVTAQLGRSVFICRWVSLCPNTLTQIIQNRLTGCQVWNNPFSRLFKFLSDAGCELRCQTWLFAFQRVLPQRGNAKRWAHSFPFCSKVISLQSDRPDWADWTSSAGYLKDASMFVSKCHLSDLQHSGNDPFFKTALKCDRSERAKPLNKVGVRHEKPISPALSETLRERDRLMRMNGRPPTS